MNLHQVEMTLRALRGLEKAYEELDQVADKRGTNPERLAFDLCGEIREGIVEMLDTHNNDFPDAPKIQECAGKAELNPHCDVYLRESDTLNGFCPACVAWRAQ